jgi:CBS domain-containing protein
MAEDLAAVRDLRWRLWLRAAPPATKRAIKFAAAALYSALSVHGDTGGALMELTDTVRHVLRQKGPEVWSVDAETLVYDAIALMATKGIGALLVVSEGKLAGVISERDYARKVALHGKRSEATQVKEIMTSPVISVAPDDTVEDCLKIMTGSHVRHLPIVEDERVVGILSIGDLVKWVISAQQQTIQQLHNYINGNYPG